MTRFFFFVILVLWVFVLADILQSRFEDSTHKLIWILVVIFIPVLGALLYLTIGKKQKLQ